jgi:hypothetical protein
MDMQMHSTTASLDTRHRPWLDLLPRHTSYDRLIHITLSNRGVDDGMNLRCQVL